MVDTVGQKLQRARLAKKLEIEEVAEATKIRPDRIIDLETNEYGYFPNLTYARSFLMKYARYLQVDIQEELENFQVGHSISWGEYQYLTPAPSPKSSGESRKIPPKGFRVPPFVVGALVLIVLVGVPLFSYLAVNISRLYDNNGVTATITSSEKNASKAPKPIDSPASSADSLRSMTQAAGLPGNSAPTPALSTELAAGDQLAKPTPYASRGHDEFGVEVRRALPVDPFPATENAPRPEVAPLPNKKLEVRLLKRTWVKVARDTEGAQPVYEGFAGPDSRPITVIGKRFWIWVLDKSAVEVRKDGQVVVDSSDDIVIN